VFKTSNQFNKNLLNGLNSHICRIERSNWFKVSKFSYKN